jgi:hypothetical protein
METNLNFIKPKDIDDGITLEKDDDEKTQSKQRLCDRTCKTFIIVGLLSQWQRAHCS